MRSGCSCFLALAFGLGFVGFGLGAGGVGVGDVFRDAAGGRASRRSPTPSRRCSTTRRTPRRSRIWLPPTRPKATRPGLEAMTSYISLKPEEHGRAPRARSAVPAESVDRAGARADLLRCAPTTSRPGPSGTRSSSSAAARSRPTPSRTPSARRTSARSPPPRRRSREPPRKRSRRIADHRDSADRPHRPAQLAQAAQSANDTATVIAAYEAFLKLAPDDPTAPEVRKILKQYKQFGNSARTPPLDSPR